MSLPVRAADPATPLVPANLLPVLVAVVAVGAVVVLVLTLASGERLGRTVVVVVAGVPAACGLGVLTGGAGALRWLIGIAAAVLGALAVLFPARDQIGEGR